jgi:hypothetical protein
MTHRLTTARSEPRSYELRPDRAFGHARHVGTCAACQRAQLARWGRSCCKHQLPACIRRAYWLLLYRVEPRRFGPNPAETEADELLIEGLRALTKMIDPVPRSVRVSAYAMFVPACPGPADLCGILVCAGTDRPATGQDGP